MKSEMDASSITHVGAGNLLKLNLKGNFTWELLFDIDNTGNSGAIRKVIEYKTSITSSYSEMRKNVKSYMTDSSIATNLGGILFDIVNVGINSEISSEIRGMYEILFEKKVEMHQEQTQRDEYNIGPNSKLKLYRLVFNGPGVHNKTETVSSTPHPMEDVLIDVTVKPIPILESIDICYTDDSVSRPDGTITMTWGDNPDINKGFHGQYVWLVPKWTTSINKGVTDIQIVIQGHENEKYADMAKGAGGDYRYMRISKDSQDSHRIIRIALYRTEDKYDDPLHNGWQRRSIDINRGRGGDYLYLVWQVQAID